MTGLLKVLGQTQGNISAVATLLLRLCLITLWPENDLSCLLCAVKKKPTSNIYFYLTGIIIHTHPPNFTFLYLNMQCCLSAHMYLASGSKLRPYHPVKHNQALCVHNFTRNVPSFPLTLECLPAEHRGQRSHLHHLFPSVSSHAAGQAPQQRRGHSHPALDFHQIISGEAKRNFNGPHLRKIIS